MKIFDPLNTIVNTKRAVSCHGSTVPVCASFLLPLFTISLSGNSLLKSLEILFLISSPGGRELYYGIVAHLTRTRLKSIFHQKPPQPYPTQTPIVHVGHVNFILFVSFFPRERGFWYSTGFTGGGHSLNRKSLIRAWS